ncbi:hypothetical protein M9458_028941, partial [Cirrhinus mrigala]
MNDPAVFVLLLEQGERSLEDHTMDFVLATYIEWVLVSCKSSVTMDFADNDTSPAPDPVPSPTSPRSAERQPEPTVDGEPKPSATDEPSPRGATELKIGPEPEPITSDQVRELAILLTTEEVSVEHEDAEEGPTHCTSIEGEQKLELKQKDLINFEDIYADMPPFIPSSEQLVNPEPSVCPDLSACLDFPPTLPLMPHPLIPASAMPPLSPDSPSAHPQSTICVVGSQRVCQFLSASWLEDPSSPHLRLQPPGPGLRLDPLAQRLHPSSWLPRLHHRPSPHQLHRAPSSLCPWSIDSTLPAAPHRLSLGLCSGLAGSPSPCRAPPPLAPPPLVGPLESSAIRAAAWVSPSSSCSGSLLSPSWLLPPSDPPWILLSSPWLLPPSSPPPSSARASSYTDLLLPFH